MRLLLSLGFALMILTLPSTALAKADEFNIIGIYYFGCDGNPVDKIKESMPVLVGDTFTQAEGRSVVEKISNAVKQAIGSPPTDVAVVDCGKHTWNIYIGLPGRSIVKIAHTPSPGGSASISPEGKRLHDEMIRSSITALASMGSVTEDDSRGYALSNDPAVRKKQLAFRAWAMTHKTEINTVLTSSANPQQRAIAADALGYIDPSKPQIVALAGAARDENSAVRNNAIRALACIASAKKELAREIPADAFIEMLNSSTWTDRNKAVFLLTRLCRQEAVPRKTIRERALQGLAEIACWDVPHAAGARYLLGSADGLSESQLEALFTAGDTAAIVRVYGGQGRSSETHASKHEAKH